MILACVTLEKRSSPQPLISRYGWQKHHRPCGRFHAFGLQAYWRKQTSKIERLRRVCFFFFLFLKRAPENIVQKGCKRYKMRCGRPGLTCHFFSSFVFFNVSVVRLTWRWYKTWPYDLVSSSSTTWVAMFFTPLKHHIVTYYSSTFITFSCV